MNVGIPLLIDIYIFVKLIEALDRHLHFWNVIFLPFIVFAYTFLAVSIFYLFN
jgi:hypothetical protein